MTQPVPVTQKSALPPPYSDIDTLFSRFMRGWPFVWPEPRNGEPRALRAFEHVPNVEVKENGKSYNVAVELPGLDEKDVKVTVKGDILTISGEKKIEKSDEKTHFSERSYGSFARSFTLPPDADRNSVAARFSKGVLTLEIAKSSNAPDGGKQIDIKAA